jgi:Zn finger protein HypA/HybF involved in hydrogenase expression
MTLLATLIGVAARPAWSANVETLLMPGKLSTAHAKFEATCTSCHDRSDRSRMTGLCLDCHTETRADIESLHRFHGRMSNAANSQCRACHTEHKGRDAPIADFPRAGFDHSLTDFALAGAHQQAPCESCHRQGVAYRKADPACSGCHRNADVHKGALGTACANCHSAAAWNEVAFDHDKTAFKLREAHAKIECNTCHFGPRYKGTPTACSDCHAPDDVHRGSRGNECGKCHVAASWKSATFDHGRQTGFALRGAHADIACAACHRTGNFKDKIPKDCKGCHAALDAHADRFGADCGACHGEVAWLPVPYDHAKSAHFALEGGHAKLACHTCHTAEVWKQKLGTGCSACHRAQDPHGGAVGTRCEQCHGSESWKTALGFDHDLTTYPLVGQHVLATCAQCHATLKFSAAAKDCHSCHAAQDVHHGSLGKDCAACHSPNGWTLWEFDHAKETGFALAGAHRKLKCADCHRQPPKEVKLATQCVACHQKDDIHVGEFGRQCQRCHTAVSFSAARIQ